MNKELRSLWNLLSIESPGSVDITANVILLQLINALLLFLWTKERNGASSVAFDCVTCSFHSVPSSTGSEHEWRYVSYHHRGQVRPWRFHLHWVCYWFHSEQQPELGLCLCQTRSLLVGFVWFFILSLFSLSILLHACMEACERFDISLHLLQGKGGYPTR